MSSKNQFVKRFLMMLTGILFISICVGCYRLSGFGVDAFTCMNLGISGFIHMSFLAADYECSDPDRCIFYRKEMHWSRNYRKYGMCRLRG